MDLKNELKNERVKNEMLFQKYIPNIYKNIKLKTHEKKS